MLGGRLTRRIRRICAQCIGISRNLSTECDASNSKFLEAYDAALRSGDMYDNSGVRGFIIMRPRAVFIWEKIREFLDGAFKQYGVQNAYFPMFIPLSVMSKEAEHIQGFATESAIVTHTKLEIVDGTLTVKPESKLGEPLIVRPTSESIIWRSLTERVRDTKDLPVLLNQWCNVIRWEMHPRPFIRTSEFLWQEGHTCHAEATEALSLSKNMLSVYEQLCEKLLALPVISGEKPISERFSGAENTLTIEAIMNNGWAIQCGTSHYLGTNFAKAFNVKYQPNNGERQFVHGTSWGVSTRLIGATVMTHMMQSELVLPPPVAQVQASIIPVFSAKSDNDKIVELTDLINTKLVLGGIRTHNYGKLGNKRNRNQMAESDCFGVPLKIRVGQQELNSDTFSLINRLSRDQASSPMNNVNMVVAEELKNMQQEKLYHGAISRMMEKLRFVTDFQQILDGLKDGANFAYLVPWKSNPITEKELHQSHKLYIRCYPFVLNPQLKCANGQTTVNEALLDISPVFDESMKCIFSGEQATHMALMSKAF